MKTDAFIRRLKDAMPRGTWDGRAVISPYFASCRVVDLDRGMVGIYTRDTGHHSSGWWKNPDYERCFHLSLSFHDPETKQASPRNAKLTAQVVAGVFGSNKRWLWCEPPYSDDGKRADVWHYRLFADQGWNPIKPRGEVYSRELAEAGWRSFSDVQAELEREAAIQRELRTA